MQSVLEITTPVCRNAGDVMRWLTTLRGYVTEIAHERHTRVGLGRDAPLQPLRAPAITAKDRYHALIDQMQYVARRELIFGMHVHVAIDDPEKAIQVVNGLLRSSRRSSRSPRAPRSGAESRRASRRAARWSSRRSRAQVPPPRFRDYADYASVVGQLERTGCIADYTHIWWDIRLIQRLGTVEIASATR
jgi:carboxylate-amine ligase